MERITFVIPSRNNLEFIKIAYNSIKKLKYAKHDILILNDASTDGTSEWLESLEDDNLLVYTNEGPERIGIVGMFDKGIEMAKTEIIFAFHADMVAGPDLDMHVLRYLQPGTVVTATRVEPPLHPSGPEKITENFGIEAEEFDYDKWESWCISPRMSSGQVTEGIFAPWCMYKKDFLAVGGHDELFAPQSKEDSDLFNRFSIAGYKFIQTWDALVYHFTSRGSRFNKHSGGAAGKNSKEWLYTTNKNMKNFIRKWGSNIKHDDYMKPIVKPKYNIGITIKNCTNDLLTALEPWGDLIFVDMEIDTFVKAEQEHTIMDMSKRVFSINAEKDVDIELRVDGTIFNAVDYSYIQEMSSIIKNSGQVGHLKVGNIEVIINKMEEQKIGGIK